MKTEKFIYISRKRKWKNSLGCQNFVKAMNQARVLTHAFGECPSSEQRSCEDNSLGLEKLPTVQELRAEYVILSQFPIYEDIVPCLLD